MYWLTDFMHHSLCSGSGRLRHPSHGLHGLLHSPSHRTHSPRDHPKAPILSIPASPPDVRHHIYIHSHIHSHIHTTYTLLPPPLTCALHVVWLTLLYSACGLLPEGDARLLGTARTPHLGRIREVAALPAIWTKQEETAGMRGVVNAEVRVRVTGWGDWVG